MSRNLEKRLTKIEQRLLDVAREQLGDCNCRKFSCASASNLEEFEEEMNRPCPAHGFRNLGQIFHTVIVPLNDAGRENDAKAEKLIKTYEARRARHEAERETE